VWFSASLSERMCTNGMFPVDRSVTLGYKNDMTLSSRGGWQMPRQTGATNGKRREIHVRFTIEKGLWEMYRGACLIDGRDRYGQLRKLIKEWTAKKVKRVSPRR
jgi:hypothetical protein